jgi:hypothetical protein
MGQGCVLMEYLCLQVRGFATRNESNLAMFNSGSDTVLGAVHFYKDASTSQISFLVQSNTSVSIS